MADNKVKLPSYDNMLVPTLQALQGLSGSGSINEIFSAVAKNMRLSPEVLAVLHGNTGQTEVEYRLAWSRTYLRSYGLIEKSSRGVWALMDKSIDIATINPDTIVKAVRSKHQTKPEQMGNNQTDTPEGINSDSDESDLADWPTHLHNELLALTPDGFERLAQRLLRESGFVRVEVTGKTGDGGIDGIGIARINGFLSFTVLFQCKRYKGSVSPSQIRDFRGAMQGRTDKGLFITTGTFTSEAIKEATRDGAPPIDLIDGEALVERLKELRLGVNIRMVESVEIDREWFARL